MIKIPLIEDKEQLFDWLIANKAALVAQKKASEKEADAISYMVPLLSDKGDVIKSEVVPITATKVKVRSIINTTKLLDSHGDVHIDQLWNKSIKEARHNYLVQEHNFSYSGIISSDVKAFTKQMTWAELGYGGFEGNTQALIYDSVIDLSKVTYGQGAGPTKMGELYKDGLVNNHSVGMRYVSLDMAINDSRYEKEFAIWEKYYPIIANKSDADAQGYFWAVTAGKNNEGSAVVKGSNFVTPTYSVQEMKQQAKVIAKKEPLKGTQISEELKRLSKILNS